MRISKKILSVVLAVLMLASVCLVPSVAASPLDGTEDAAKINVKYEVEQVNTAYDDMLVTEEKDIYAVTVYVKAQYGINVVQVPLYFDADLFAPIMWSDDDPVGNGALGYDGWYDSEGSGQVYDFVKGKAWTDASWYRSNGNAATSFGNARYVGLGNSQATLIQYKAEYVDPSNTAKYDSYNTVSDDNFDGYMFVSFINKTEKTGYCNAFENAVVTDYISLATFYFMRQEGVSAEDCYGAQFGWAEGGDWLTQTDWDTSGKPSYYGQTYVQGVPGVKYVSNAVVTAQSPVYAKGSQIRFNNGEVDETKAWFDVRTRAALKAEDFVAICGSEDNAKALADAGKLQVGFVYKANIGDPATIDLATAKAVATGATADGYYNKTVTYIQSTGTEYVWTCLIRDADYNGSVQALGYIIVDGTPYFFDEASLTTFSTLYDTWYDDYAATLS